MDARIVSHAAKELAWLKRLELERLGVALAAALVAGPAALLDARLGLALGVGAMFEAVFALTSFAQRRALVASLALRRDAYFLPEVRRYGEALATMQGRQALARSIAGLLRYASRGALVELVDRVASQAPVLAALGRALIEPENDVEPTAAVACSQLLRDARRSPLLNPAVPRAELDATLRRIHAGISPRPRTDAATSTREPRQPA